MSLLQDHHIIPENFASNDVIRSLTELHLFDIQASRNRIYLPADRQLAFEIGTSRHAHHLDSYDDVVKDQLELARRNAGENSEALQAEVATLIDAMRIALAKGHLYTNAPAGMTSGQANDENRKFTDRRGRPAGSRRRHRPIATFAIWSRRWFLRQMDAGFEEREAGVSDAARRLHWGGMLGNAVHVAAVVASLPYIAVVPA